MPIHFNDLDVVSEVEGLSSVLIVPCNMCPAVTVAVRERKPFMQLFRSFLKSVPFEQYLKTLQSRLRENGVSTKVFKSIPYHQWFMCIRFHLPGNVSFENCKTVPISQQKKEEDISD